MLREMLQSKICQPRGDTGDRATVTVTNALTRYHAELERHMRRSAPPPASTRFDPGWDLPAVDDALVELFAPSTISWTPLGTAGDVTISVLDLRSNPATRTTKTNPSLLMVARAVAHIRRTGERVVIVTPSSANKATALRDAVGRAIAAGLVPAEQLQIVSVVPPEGVPKLWASQLDADPGLLRRNPVAVYRGDERVGVKALVKELAGTAADAIERAHGVRLWFTLDLENYRWADALRAFVELDHLPPPATPRVHAHAVSSAFGLLGHAHGWELRGSPLPHPGYFLVQHLDTPDMVLELCTGGFDRSGLPEYTYDGRRGLFVQDDDPHFPLATYDVDEVLDPTFYTHRPTTQPAMRRLIERHGGGGIVVSLHECLARYGEIRHRLEAAGIVLPADPRAVREWSLIMAMTGLLNAVERRLLGAGTEVVVHASGSYAVDDFDPIPSQHLVPVGDSHDLADLVAHAAAATP